MIIILKYLPILDIVRYGWSVFNFNSILSTWMNRDSKSIGNNYIGVRIAFRLLGIIII